MNNPFRYSHSGVVPLYVFANRASCHLNHRTERRVMRPHMHVRPESMLVDRPSRSSPTMAGRSRRSESTLRRAGRSGARSRPHAAAQTTPSATAAQAPPAIDRALLDRYCVACHNERIKTAGLMLDKVDVAQVSANAETLEKVVRKLRTGQMPPAGSRVPTGRRRSMPSPRHSRRRSTRRRRRRTQSRPRCRSTGSTASNTSTSSAICWRSRSTDRRSCRPTTRASGSTTTPTSSPSRRR